jgi:hypothetical protein
MIKPFRGSQSIIYDLGASQSSILVLAFVKGTTLSLIDELTTSILYVCPSNENWSPAYLSTLPFFTLC